MDSNEIRLWISRILSGTKVIDHKKYQVPTLNEASETVYQETFSEAIFLGCFTSDECEELTNPIKTEPIREKIKQLKIELYNLRNNPQAAENIRRQLVAAKKDFTDAVSHNGKYYQYSAEFLASFARDYCEIEFERPTEEQIREIARSGTWYAMWSAQKLRCFPKKLTEDQIELICWTNKYINILKNSKRPEIWVIDDDDMLDGWMLANQDEDKKPEIVSGDGDIMVFAKTPGEAQKIWEMNDALGKATIEGRKKFIEKNGQVKEQDLPDVKRNIALEINSGT